METETELLTIEQVGNILHVSRAKVYDFINDQKNPLPVFYLSDRTPRIKRNELNQWIETQSQIQKDNLINDEEKKEGGEK